MSWVPQEEAALGGFRPDHTGYWAVSTHAEVAAVSKNSTDYSTAANGVIMRFAPEMTKEEREQTGFLLINHDAPDHTKLRQIVSRAFTPRAVNALHDELKTRAEKIWADAVEALARGMKNGDAAAGFEVAIGLCGDVLAEHFPPRATNPNEVEDRLVLI